MKVGLFVGVFGFFGLIFVNGNSLYVFVLILMFVVGFGMLFIVLVIVVVGMLVVLVG